MNQKNLSKPTIKALFAKQLIDIVGKEESKYLELSNTTFSKLESLEYLSVEELKELIHSIQNHLNDEMLGLFSKSIPLNSFPTIYRALHFMPNADHAIQWLNDYYGLYSDAPPYVIFKNNEEVTIKLDDRANANSALPVYSEILLICLYKIVCRLCRVNFPLKEVGLSFPIEGIESELSYLFGNKNIVTSEVAYIRFSKGILKLPIYPDGVPDNSSLYSYFLTWIEGDNIALQVRNMITSRVPLTFPTLEELAKEFDTSSQTLRRKLSEEGNSYQAIKDTIRKDRAISLLMNPAIPIKNIALELGFSDPAAFNKSFKNWFMTTPSSYRKKYLKNG
ncbi:hypothetical protein A9Q99_24360 [Gammaproteobacteria bacterium 45_16_T64]|nr:hypothetical protein A9Q99_24360 [Gammaproteobacteria bacterium 45_16_T64]